MTPQTKLVVAGALGLVVGGFAVFGVSWGIVHGVLELGQWAFSGMGWTWEPIWYQTMVGTLIFNVITSSFRSSK